MGDVERNVGMRFTSMKCNQCSSDKSGDSDSTPSSPTAHPVSDRDAFIREQEALAERKGKWASLQPDGIDHALPALCTSSKVSHGRAVLLRLFLACRVLALRCPLPLWQGGVCGRGSRLSEALSSLRTA